MLALNKRDRIAVLGYDGNEVFLDENYRNRGRTGVDQGVISK